VSFPTIAGRAVECTPFREPQVNLGTSFANAYYLFFVTATSTPANVYQNGVLTSPFSPTGKVTADSYGRFPAIYLDPSVTYKVQLYNSSGVLQRTTDPYGSQLSTVGTSSLSAYGISIAPTGEVTIPAPNTGGTGNSLTLNAGDFGSVPLAVNGTLAGNSALIIDNAATIGAQTASFNANNKPGTPPTTYNVTLTVAPSGGAYVGGTLTANFTGLTASNYTVQLSTGQDIFGCTLTNGSTTFTCPSTTITGTPTAALIVTTPVTPAGWLPITCDGVPYYTPIWHGNNFTPYVATPSAVGETITGSTVTFGGSGLTTVTGTGAATPPNWYSPAPATGIGAGYYINVTQTGGAGAFTGIAPGMWTSIGAGGITIGNSGTAVNGTYQLSSSALGSPIVAAGTISLVPFAQTNTYVSGSGTETVPLGASFLEVIADGGGGSGSTAIGHIPPFEFGGGGSGRAHSTGIAVSGGQTLTYSVGAGGAGVPYPGGGTGNAGTASTVTGNGGLAAVSLTAGGGGPGVTNTNPGAGGVASGGNLANLTGSPGGSGGSAGLGGNAASGALRGNPPAAPGAGSDGGHAAASTSGARGQVQFIYT
jgi:hypothetical protein